MKSVSAATVLGIGLALVLTGQPAGSWADSAPAIAGRGDGIGGQPSQFTQSEPPGHLIVQGQPTTTRAIAPLKTDGDRGAGSGHGTPFGRDHSHFRGHRHFIVVFVNGVPCWFPVYTYYPYGYDVPVDISSSTVSDTSDDGYVPAVNGSDVDSGPCPQVSEYTSLGLSWGQDLRREVASWSQFVAFLRTHIVTAPASAQADFREAFINAYRLNGATAYDKAAAEAAGIPTAPAPGPKVITFPPPPPPSGS